MYLANLQTSIKKGKIYIVGLFRIILTHTKKKDLIAGLATFFAFFLKKINCLPFIGTKKLLGEGQKAWIFLSLSKFVGKYTLLIYCISFNHFLLYKKSVNLFLLFFRFKIHFILLRSSILLFSSSTRSLGKFT